MSIYGIGDLHLSFHPSVEKPMDVFGDRWKNHTEKLYEYWNDTIRENDTVIIAGDISWGLRLEEAIPDLDWIDSLNGRKVIFKGNHDLWWTSLNKVNSLYYNITFVQNKSFIVEEDGRKIAICGSRGWICPGTDGFNGHDQKMYERETIRLEMSLEDAKFQEADEIIGVLHYPPTNDRFHSSNFTELFHRYGVKSCIYGHLHGREAFKNGLKGIFKDVEYNLVSLDYLNCKPIKIKI